MAAVPSYNATTSSLPSPIHHLYQNLCRDVNTSIVQTRGGHDRDRETTRSAVVKTSWRPANERWPFSDAEKRAKIPNGIITIQRDNGRHIHQKQREKKTNAANCENAAAIWIPGVAPANLELQEVAQNQTCRIITQCLRIAPATVLEHEMDLFPFAMRRRQVAAATAQ